MQSDVQVELQRLYQRPIASYNEWAEIALRIFKLVDTSKSSTCSRYIVELAKYNSANYFAIARLLAQFVDDKASVTRIAKGTFELIINVKHTDDFMAAYLFVLAAVNELTISYCSAQVRKWRDECRALNIPFKDRAAFGKYGRTEAVRDSFFAQALEALYIELVNYFENNKNNF